MQQIEITIEVNPQTLTAELRAVWPDAGMSWTEDTVFAIMPDSFEQTTYDALLAAHNPALLTSEQEAELIEASAIDRASAIPGYATWNEAEALAYIEANVTDLDSAKAVMSALARMIIAVRDQLWPHLTLEG